MEGGGFYLAKLAGDWSTSHYVDEVLNDCPWCDCEIKYYKWLEGTNKFILVKESEYFSILNGDII